MTSWTNEELSKIGAADELQIAPRRGDGTFRTPVPIWVVGVGDDLYIRSWRGRGSVWFRGTQGRHEGQIQAGGITKDVTFVEVDANDAIQHQIDAAYRSKYRHSGGQYVEPMVAPEARAATLQLVPGATT